MQTVLIVKCADYLIGFNRDHVLAVAGQKSKHIRKKIVDGAEYLLLSKGRTSKVIRMEHLLNVPERKCENGRYVLVGDEKELTTILVSSQTSSVSVFKNALQALPPVFPKEARMLFPEMLLNGKDGIFMLAPHRVREKINKEELPGTSNED